MQSQRGMIEDQPKAVFSELGQREQPFPFHLGLSLATLTKPRPCRGTLRRRANQTITSRTLDSQAGPVTLVPPVSLYSLRLTMTIHRKDPAIMATPVTLNHSITQTQTRGRSLAPTALALVSCHARRIPSKISAAAS